MLSIFRRLQPLRIIKLRINCQLSKSVNFTTQLTKHNTSVQHNLILIRHKSKGKEIQNEQSTETENEEDNFQDKITDKHTKIMNVDVGSLRIDGLLKAGLGIARNKIDVIFYDSKIRVNGQKILKKSVNAEVGDEIDILKGVSPQNPDLLTVARVEILDIKEVGDTFNVKLRRCKSLLVENYDKELNT